MLRTYLLAFTMIGAKDSHKASLFQADAFTVTNVNVHHANANANANPRIRPLHMSTIDVEMGMGMGIISEFGMKDERNQEEISQHSIAIQPITITRERSKESSRNSNSKENNNVKKKRKKRITTQSTRSRSRHLDIYASKNIHTSKNNKIRSNSQNNKHDDEEDTSRRRLTREEEISLTQSIRQLKSIIRTRDQLAETKSSPNHNPVIPNPMYREPVPKFPYKNHPTEQEWADACDLSVPQLRKILMEGREARSRLVSSNVGLVLQFAKRYDYELRKSSFDGIGSILTLSDLVQEGNLGLMEAAERYDASKGARFGTYAAFWVKQRILRSITDNGRVIRLPAHVHNQIRTIRKARSDMENERGRPPSLPELADRLEMSQEKLQLYNDSSRSVLSLEGAGNGRSSSSSSSKSGAGEPDKRTLGERIASDGPTPEEDAEFDFLRRDVRAAIDALGNDRERDVLCSRFGLIDGNPRTLKETGERLGISTERVRIIENRALNKLRHPQRNYRLKEYVHVGNSGGGGVGGGVGVGGVSHYQDEAESVGIYGSQRDGRGRARDSRVMRQNLNDMGGDALAQFTPEKIWSF